MLPSETTAVAGTEVRALEAYGVVGVPSECVGLAWVTSWAFQRIADIQSPGLDGIREGQSVKRDAQTAQGPAGNLQERGTGLGGGAHGEATGAGNQEGRPHGDPGHHPWPVTLRCS